MTLRTESDQVPTHTVPVETNDDNSVTFKNWVKSSKATCFQAVTSTVLKKIVISKREQKDIETGTINTNVLILGNISTSICMWVVTHHPCGQS